jgi:hypothetical protein
VNGTDLAALSSSVSVSLVPSVARKLPSIRVTS